MQTRIIQSQPPPSLAFRSGLGQLLAAPTLVSALLVSVGCGESEGDAHADIKVIDRSADGFDGTARSINGTYGPGCTDRSGDWSLAIDVGAALTNPELSVVLNDSGCVLTMTSLVEDGVTTSSTPAIDLGTSYQFTPSSFGSPTIEFYGNAKLSTVDYEGDFVLTLLYSDDPSNATGDNTAGFVVSESSATAQEVAAPDYTLDMSAISVQTDADDVVQSASGDAVLTDGAVTGQQYVVADATGLDTYAEIDTAYLAGTPSAVTGTIPAGDFTLVGSDLTASEVRTLIVANIDNGVRSYQAFEISFHAAQ